jgi:ankyrin repeat protein
MTEQGAFESSKPFEIICLLEEDAPTKFLEAITSGADVDMTDGCGNGYLHLLCGNSELNDTSPAVYVPLMYQLANTGVNVNAQNNNGNTALHFAVTNNVIERVINVLLKIGSDMNLSNSDGLTPLEMCNNSLTLKTFDIFSPGLPAVVQNRNTTRLEQLMKCWCYSKNILTDEGIVDTDDVDEEKDFSNLLKQGMEKTAFIHAALAGDKARMRTTYKKDIVNVNAEDHSYINSKGDIRAIPLLIETINMNLVESVKFLVKKKVNVNMEFSFRNESSGPFYHYFATTCPQKRQETLALVMKTADISLLNANIGIEFLDRLWKERFPEEVLGKYIHGGISLNIKDSDFYTLRDKVLLDSLTCDTQTRKKNLFYVDQHLLNLVENGNLESIKNLFDDGYEHILIENPQGRNSLSVARKANQAHVVSFLEALPTLQVSSMIDPETRVRLIHSSILFFPTKVHLPLNLCKLFEFHK